MPDSSVAEWMDAFTHPLRPVLEAARGILTHLPGVGERVKWNAPSYHHDGTDIATFMVRRDDEIVLIFHHPETPSIASPLLEGDYADGRRMVHFRSPDEVAAAADELRSVVARHIALIDSRGRSATP